MQAAAKPEFIYVADPMCSWCWGFAPVSKRLHAEYAATVGLRLVLGGLRPGAAAVTLDATLQTHLREHWTAVQERTGQPFA